MNTEYKLTIPSDYRRGQAIAWLWLAVTTLFVAGIFAVLLVLSRTPLVGEFLPFTDFFHTALVIHVNLSSLVWILSFACVLWAINSNPISSHIGRVIFAVVVLGTLIITVSPFLGSANALMSNYVPVLDDRLFLTGLLIFASGMGLQVIFSMSVMSRVGEKMHGEGVMRFGLNCAAIGVFMSLLAFGWSYILLPVDLPVATYYEVLFWGGGHVLQFTYTILMMVAWLWLASAAGVSLPISPRIALLLFAIGLIAIFLTPLIYLEYDVTAISHRRTFTALMSFGGSLAIVPLMAAIIIPLAFFRRKAPTDPVAWTALFTSLALFAVGGVMGFMIEGNNVKITAHYHGCIVGVSLSLMGLCYLLLPQLGYKKVSAKHAVTQLWLYAAGQFLHISGLLWSGGYGVERKVAGSDQWLNTAERVASMGIMGLGGLLSAVGGFMFIVLVFRILVGRKV